MENMYLLLEETEADPVSICKPGHPAFTDGALQSHLAAAFYMRKHLESGLVFPGSHPRSLGHSDCFLTPRLYPKRKPPAFSSSTASSLPASCPYRKWRLLLPRRPSEGGEQRFISEWPEMAWQGESHQQTPRFPPSSRAATEKGLMSAPGDHRLPQEGRG